VILSSDALKPEFSRLLFLGYSIADYANQRY
jgi:hypothetical protein